MSRVQFLWLNACCFSVLSLAALGVNLLIDQYVGNMLPFDQLLTIFIVLGLVALGFKIQFYPENHMSRFINEILLCLLVFTILFFGAISIQFTPFSPVDPILVKWDERLHMNVSELVAWVHTWPQLKKGLVFIYEGLTLELLCVPMFLIFMRRYALLREYYTLLFMSATIGYTIYYFFPTTAPASLFGGAYFSVEQMATGIKFKEIHQHLVPSTGDGGLISFPSFHVIWAWFLVYAVRCWKPLFIVLSGWNILLAISCVVLGWHYAVDVLGSMGVIVLTHWIDRFFIHDSRYFFRGGDL